MPGNVPVLSAFYRKLILSVEPRVPTSLRPLWEHPCGPKTIFFWSPLQKWCLVLAGLTDSLSRPASKLSVGQAGSLACTGFIWARYSLVIIPKNWNLFAVNFFVGLTGCFQLIKVLSHSLNHAVSRLHKAVKLTQQSVQSSCSRPNVAATSFSVQLFQLFQLFGNTEIVGQFVELIG